MTARTGDAGATEPRPVGGPKPADGQVRAPSKGRRYLTALDGLRALCALGVIVIHTQSEKRVSIPTYIYTGAFAGPLFLLFFAISGFVLYRAWARKHIAIGMARGRPIEPKVGSADGGAEGGVFKFLLRRLLRIYPLYWVVATAALLVAESTDHHGFFDYVQVYLLLPFPNPDALLSLGLGIVVWTLLIDIVFYIFVALWGMAVSGLLKRTRLDPFHFEMATLLPMAVGFALIHFAVPGPWAALSALPLGMAYAVIDAWQDTHRRRHPSVKFLLKWWWVPVAAYIPAFIAGTARVIAYKPAEYGDLLVNYLWIQIALLFYGMVLLGCIIWGPRRWGINQFLASKSMVTLGLLTYGIYLWHPVVLTLLHQNAPDLSFAAAVTITLVASAILSVITYRLIELPLSRQRKRLRDDGAPARAGSSPVTTTNPPVTAHAPETDAPGVRSAGAWCTPITGYRGIAAVLVVVGHSFMASRIYPFTSIIHSIGLIVPTFFVVSAYALYRPFLLADVEGDELPSAKRFWWKRFLRIYPLYFVALTLYLILLPGVRPQSGSTFDYIKLYTFLQVYDPDLSVFSGIPAAWFLCDEVAFYLFLPFLVMAAQALARRGRTTLSAKRRLQGHVTLAIGMVIVGMVARTYLVLNEVPAATSLPISNLDYYGFGILLAAASVAERRRQRLPGAVEWVRNRPWVALVVLAIGLGAMNIVAKNPGQSFSPNEDIGRYALYTLMVIPLMTVMVLGDQGRGWVGKLGSSKWTWLAMLSLHVYLWHQLFLGLFDRYVTKIDSVPHLGPRITTGAAIAAAAGIVTLVWSALTRPVLDRPYQRWSMALPRPAGSPPMPRWTRPVALGLGFAAVVGGTVVALQFGGSPLEVQGGVGIIQVTEAEEGDQLIVERSGKKVTEEAADAQGAMVFRNLEPATYTVEQRRSGRLVVERSTTVTALDDHPDTSLYADQSLHPGTNMITMRDGTTLSAFVTLPGPESEGPYPTVVETSAYRIGDPGTVSTATEGGGTEEIQGTQPATAVARALGYATVGVNVRGTGCSGGGFDLFGPTQAADGYDVVETVAAQPWAANNEVGLVGFSYGGLSALQVAATQPPSLRSVVALSVFGEAWQALHPGGLDNAGFPVGWLRDLQADARPAGAEWISARIEDGDSECAANQALHDQQTDMAGRFLGSVPDDSRFSAMSPTTWAQDIDVPVLVSSQFQDTTLGADLAENIASFDQAPVVRMILGNGTHGDGIAPQVLARVNDFLGLYVADQIPEPLDTESLLEETRPDVDPELVPAGPRPALHLEDFDDLDAAREAYGAEPPIEVLWEAGGADPEQAAVARWATTATTWPPSGTTPSTLFLGPDGELTAQAGPDAAPATFTTDVESASVPYSTEGSDLVTNEFSGWDQPDPTHHAAWLSAPYATDTALAGTASLELWVRTDTSDVDLQAVLLEVSDRGDETLIQTGWQRGSYRQLDDASTPLRPVVDFSPEATEPIEPGTWTKVRLRFSSFAHVLRAGSSLRLLVGTPGAAQVQWSFGPPPAGEAQVEVGQGGDEASALVVPLADVDIEPGQPSCGALRGQPCRAYEPFANVEHDSSAP